MAKNAIYRVKMRRRREGKTDYRKRLALLKSGKIRAVVRRTNKRIIVQFIRYKENGDEVLVNITSDILRRYGWNISLKSTPAAYLTGYLAGKTALNKEIKDAVFDIGRFPAIDGSRLFATLKGMLDAGMDIPHGENIFPSEERIKGEHLGKEVPKLFEEVKGKMEGEK